ncbi:hypothetical protein [Carnobacterium funditum]|uniref:hypothetical protein n=1 Tax=Carnobacterium funditum TaxID=2752 RepID=UPI00068A8664
MRVTFFKNERNEGIYVEDKITKEIQSLVEVELRKGASKSRIATLLGVPYDEANEIIDEIKASFRPDLGDKIIFLFRDEKMAGTIVKLLNNSAVVEIYWEKSSEKMKDIMESKTIVNFKDIVEFIHN